MATKDQLIASAQKNLEKGQIKKAIKDYQELLRLEPKVDQHKQKLADLLCRVDLKEEALSLYDSLAKGYADRGFFAKGVAVYKQMQRIDPARPEVYLRLAELNRSLGLNGNAMSEYRSLLDLCEKRNMAADAAGVLLKMVELEPENINLQLRILQNFLKEKLYVKATETILKACEVCAKSGDSAKSQKILQSILTHLPDNNELPIELASKLSAAGLFVDAIYVFHALLQRSPQDLAILNELATLYGKVDDAENEILLLDQLLAVQATGAIVERLVRRSLVTGDYGRVQRELEEYEALLDDENHTLLIALYQELERHLPGNQQVRCALVRFGGGEPHTPAVEPPPPAGNLSLTEKVEVLSFGAEEFDLHDLLSPLPRGREEALLSPPEGGAEEKIDDLSIELPLDEALFDKIDTFAEDLADVAMDIPDVEVSVEDLDTFAEPTLAQDSSPDDIALPVINIDFDFSEFDDVAVETDGENEAGAGVLLEADLPVGEDVDLFETTPDIALEQDSGVPGHDLSSDEEEPPLVAAIEDDTTLPLYESDYAFTVTTEAEAEAELEADAEPEVEAELEVEAEIEEAEPEEAEPEEIDRAVIEELEVELLDEVATPEEDDEEILELEPLEEEDDLDAELAALEALLDAELEEPASEQGFDLDVAVDEVANAALPVDGDFFDLAAEILDEGAMQATEGLANVGEIDRFRFDSVFAEFKKGVDAQIDHEDTEAHYDLGIAYKEMGLMDDAIEEFKKSMRSLKRLADSLILIGICYAEKGAFADAEAVFSTAIARPEVQEADKIGTQYELGLVYEVWGRPADALRTFEAVAASDSSFRNVGEKIEALRLQVSAGSSDKDTPGSVSPGKDRISFV